MKRSRLSRHARQLAGVAVVAGSFLVFAGAQFALAESSKRNDAQLIRTINVFANNLFIPFIGGFCLFVLSAGLAVAVSRAFPAWFGWIGFVLGILIFNPVGWLVGVVALLWVLASSIWMITTPVGAPGAPAATGAPPGGTQL